MEDMFEDACGRDDGDGGGDFVSARARRGLHSVWSYARISGTRTIGGLGMQR